jgi:glycosidase
MGDELGLGNTSQEELIARNGPDGRELHRPYWRHDKADLRFQADSHESRIFSKIQQMVQLRKVQAAFKGDADVDLLLNTQPQVLALQRNHDLIGLFNFSNQSIDLKLSELGLASFNASSDNAAVFHLNAYKFVWVKLTKDALPSVLID